MNPRVVGVPRRDHPARPADADHLPQRGDRVGDVLEHLVGVDHVVAGGREIQGVDVPDDDVDRAAAASVSFSAGQRRGALGGLQGRHAPGRDPLGQVNGDRAGPAAHVEHCQARA